MSNHSVPASEVSGLLRRFAERLTRKAAARTGWDFPIIVIQEACLDGFWIHRVLQSEGIESHAVDAASILTSRRRRRVKADRIDGETLVRTLMAFKRGEPRVCSMAKAPTPQLRKGWRERLEDLRTGDGLPLPMHLKAQIIRELDRLEVLAGAVENCRGGAGRLAEAGE
jgi:transposase